MSVSWKLKALFFGFLSIPAFTGLFLGPGGKEIIHGISSSSVIYLAACHLGILLAKQPQRYVMLLSISVLITIPVVFSGAIISYLAVTTGISNESLYSQSAHYIRLCINMLTVIPLALSLVSSIPFHRLEYFLLRNLSGVNKSEKILLMFMRVFNHVLFFVVPEMLEVIREEDLFSLKTANYEHRRAKGKITLIKRLIENMSLVAVDGICAAIQYIPLWAHEIGRLPEKKSKGADTK